MSQKFLVSVPLVVNGGDGDPTTLKMVFSTAPEREAQFGEDLVVYADEQGTSNPKGSADFAVGLEFGPAPIPASIVQEALNRRQCDILANPRCKDRQTQLRRTFFHATDDCNECRNILVETIRDKLHGRFFLSLRWHFADAKADHPEAAELHQHVIAMLLGIISNFPNFRRIVFKFERVEGLFAHALSHWLREDIAVRIKVMLQLGLVFCFIPIEVQEVGKGEHGIQICDHLLWRENRGLLGKPEQLEDVGMSFNHSQDHPPYKITLYRRGDITLPSRERLPEPREPGDVSWAQVVHMLYHIEANIHELAKSKPPALRHLDHIITEASQRTRGKSCISFEDFVQLHIAFLTIVRLHARQPDVTEEHRQGISDFARLAMIISQQREGSSISMFDSWHDIREGLIVSGDSRLT